MVYGIDNEVLFGVGLGAVILGYLYYQQNNDSSSTTPELRLRKFTKEDLSLYSGQGERLCYVSVNDSVYDVTKDKKDFTTHSLGGKILDIPKDDSNGQDRTEYTPIPDCINLSISSTDITNKYKKVGTLIRPRSFTLKQLREFNGTNGKPVYVCAKDMVYEVDPGFYGPEGPYGIFAGRDATRAFALMSLDEKDLDNPTLEGLKWTDLNQLNEWVARLESKYTKVGYLVK